MAVSLTFLSFELPDAFHRLLISEADAPGWARFHTRDLTQTSFHETSDVE